MSAEIIHLDMHRHRRPRRGGNPADVFAASCLLFGYAALAAGCALYLAGATSAAMLNSGRK